MSRGDLRSQITDLQNEFQRVADLHPWVSMGVPSSQHGAVVLGESFGPSTLPGVRLLEGHPEDRQKRPVLDHLWALTANAKDLLFAALNSAHRIPADIAREIAVREKEQYDFGWIRWLHFAVRMQHINRYENYAQVAATALFELKQYLCDEILEWTPPDSPQVWAKLFRFSVRTLMRRFKEGRIRHRKLSSKSYQIAVADLPADHQRKFRTSTK